MTNFNKLNKQEFIHAMQSIAERHTWVDIKWKSSVGRYIGYATRKWNWSHPDDWVDVKNDFGFTDSDRYYLTRVFFKRSLQKIK